MSYLSKNSEFWTANEIDAACVDHPVFRFYGRILRPDFPHLLGGRLLDFGCGQGSAVDYFVRHGFDARGVDVSSRAIEVGRIRYPHLRDRLGVCHPSPDENKFYGHDADVGVVTAIQSLYYFNDTDLRRCLDRIASAMKPGGVIFATMMGVESLGFYSCSTDAGDGLRKIAIKNTRMTIADYYVSFVESDEHMISKFPMFEPVHIGHYSEKFRSDEPGGFHRTFCGVKR